MTDTAKQDTTKASAAPAATESAATESAAPQGEATPETAGPDATDEPGQAGGAGHGHAALTDLDETKRKFREALERKHQAHSENQAKGGRDGGKVSGAHGPAGSRRNFRRKSG